MNVSILRVLGVRSREPSVIAAADGHLVQWRPRAGWSCACLPTADDLTCEHVVAVRSLIDPRVLGVVTTTPATMGGTR